jgi:hypothetical protein
MTSHHSTVARLDAPSPLSPPAVPDLAANIRAAQAAGNQAYAFAVESGLPLADRALAYHAAFTEMMRDLGTPMPCHCTLCQEAP